MQAQPTQAQPGAIEGAVTDAETEAPLPGVNVVIEGTRQGASTDAEGRYTISGVEAGTYDLQASFVGYATEAVAGVEVQDGERTTVNVALQPSTVALDEVVAVGYGTQQRSDITGAVASVSPQRLEEVPNVNFAQALQGSVPGLSVTTNSAGAEQSNLGLLLRGQNSITASNRPLIVIDGIPYGGSISEVNQSDIASIEVLKDASSAAIYGARGSNGVILISTKQGHAGKPRFNYDGYIGAQQSTNVPDVMTGPEFAAFKCERLAGGENCESAFTATELASLEQGTSTDWIDLATRTGTQQQHNLSVTGGTESFKYYVSGALLDVEGVAKNDAFNRYSLRVNLDQTIGSWFTLGTATQLSQADRTGLSARFDRAFYMNPLAPAYGEDGTQLIYPWDEDRFFDNPLAGLLVDNSDLSRRALTNNFAEVQVPFVKGLSYRLNTGIDYRTRDERSYYGRNTSRGFETQGRSITKFSHSFDWTVENILRYERSFGVHRVDLTGLYSAQGENYDLDRVQADGFPNDVLTTYQGGVAEQIVPAYDVSESRIVSQMGRINYSYASKYLLTLTARRDGYSGFGANNKYGFFPSVALGWNLAREPFMDGAESINNLKLRLSYGKNGNQAINPFQTFSRLTESSYVLGGSSLPGYRPATLGNPNLRWETTTSLNLGLDFGLFANRISGSLDAYFTRTKDLLLDRQISPVHGISRITENIGKTKNRGIELALSSVNLDRGDLLWRMDFNISANRNEIVALYGDAQDDVGNRWFIGRPINVNYGYVMESIWQEGDDIANSAQPDAHPGSVRVKDVNGDGQITPEGDRTFIGRRNPLYAAGLTNTVSYKNFTLSAFVHTVQGLTRHNSLLDPGGVWTGVRRNTVQKEYWSPENPINTYPANRVEPSVNSFGVSWYQDASFIRLKDVTLSYDLPQSIRGRLGASKLRVYVNGRNLWTLTDWVGLDPELGNQRATPLERSFIGGINVQF